MCRAVAGVLWSSSRRSSFDSDCHSLPRLECCSSLSALTSTYSSWPRTRHACDGPLRIKLTDQHHSLVSFLFCKICDACIDIQCRTMARVDQRDYAPRRLVYRHSASNHGAPCRLVQNGRRCCEEQSRIRQTGRPPNKMATAQVPSCFR